MTLTNDPYPVTPDPDDDTGCAACQGHGWLVGETGRRSVRCPWCTDLTVVRGERGSVRGVAMGVLFLAVAVALVVLR